MSSSYFLLIIKSFRHAPLFEDIGGEYNIPMVANAKTAREFDEGITRVSFGFKSADDYYLNSSSADSIKHVCTPLLCIQENQNCLLIVTPNGCHLGWVAGNEAPFGAPWTDPCVIDFLQHLDKRLSETSGSHSQLNEAPMCTEGGLVAAEV